MTSELLCEGVNTHMICAQVNGVKLNAKDIIPPTEYKNWTVEKAVYNQNEDKLYIQISYHNLRKIIIL